MSFFVCFSLTIIKLLQAGTQGRQNAAFFVRRVLAAVQPKCIECNLKNSEQVDGMIAFCRDRVSGCDLRQSPALHDGRWMASPICQVFDEYHLQVLLKLIVFEMNLFCNRATQCAQ